jgi:hypothetical protein
MIELLFDLTKYLMIDQQKFDHDRKFFDRTKNYDHGSIFSYRSFKKKFDKNNFES